MKKKILILMVGFLLVGVNLYAADGDLIVNGTIGLPTTTSSVGIIKQATNRFIHSYGTDNVFMGKDSGNFTLTGNSNLGIGVNTLNVLTSGDNNTAIGTDALKSNTTGGGNLALGKGAMDANQTASYNVAIGGWALGALTGASYNVAIGVSALENTTTGSLNTAIGGSAMMRNISGKRNIAVGSEALFENTTGDFNIGIGGNTLTRQQGGDNNVAIGTGAGRGSELHSKSGGVFIGHQAGQNENNSNRLYIENSNSPTPLIYGEFDNDLVRINGDLDVEGNVEAWGFITGDITFQKDGKKLWRMFEDEEGLYIKSLKTGKVYRFVLQEVEKK